MILKDGYHLLTLKEEAALILKNWAFPAYCQLDVTILHQMLEKEFGIDEAELRAQSKSSIPEAARKQLSWWKKEKS